MPTLRLTKRAVDVATPIDGRRTLFFDEAVTGFGLLVSEKGAKSFFVQYRTGPGRAAAKKRVAIGRYAAPWTVETARQRARQLLARVTQGEDPAAEKTRARTAVPADRRLEAVIERWLAVDQKHNRSCDEVARLMRREVVPVLGKRPIEQIGKVDIIELVEGIAERAPVVANRVLAHTKTLFHWAAGRDIIAADPSTHVAKPTPEVRRDRVLDDDELLAVWRAAEAMEQHPYGVGVRLLILTGARREEIFGARWSELDASRSALRLPAERAKTKEGRAIALGEQAMHLVTALPRINDFMLTTGRVRNAARAATGAPFSNFGTMKVLLDDAVAAARRDAAEPERAGEPLTEAERQRLALPDWRLHDLRRTVATDLQKLGTPLEVIETVLGHVSGSRAGIVGVYQRHRYEDEARAALVAWDAQLRRLLDPGSTHGGVRVRFRRPS